MSELTLDGPPGSPLGPSVSGAPEASSLVAILPSEIAFLAGYGLSQATLRHAADLALQTNVSADCALLTAGLLSAPQFYEMLAHHLGVEYLHEPVPIASGVRLEDAMEVQIVPAATNPAGFDFLLAPRGETLALLLRRFDGVRSSGGRRVALTSPQRLAALVRLHHRHTIVRDASHALPDWNPGLSVLSGWSLGQRLFGFVLGAALSIGAGLALRATLEAVCLAFSVLFLAMVAVRLMALSISPSGDTSEEPRRPDRDLPIYTVVVPLYRESRIVRRLIAALERLDYPASRLDIKIVVEADDRETLEALHAEHLSDRFEVLMAPPGHPQTKPRALNIAMRFARGAFLVIYDAEDEPEPGQLRAAVAAFEAAPPDLACLQGRLAIDNGTDSWLTRLFTLEYASLFDVINPGLARLGLPIPLGGTSNHFRIEALKRVNGWDAWNVTEDIDLGIRLARFGYRIGMLQSSTFEEAPVRLRAWLGQRRRWQKGWIATLKTHSRDPARLIAEMGAASAVATFAMLGGTVATALLGPFFLAALVLDARYGPLLAPHTPSEIAWSSLAATTGALGAVSLLVPIGVGMRRRGRFAMAGWAMLLPAYLLLLSVASWQGLWDTFGRPYAWTKTEHGLAKHRERLVRP